MYCLWGPSSFIMEVEQTMLYELRVTRHGDRAVHRPSLAPWDARTRSAPARPRRAPSRAPCRASCRASCWARHGQQARAEREPQPAQCPLVAWSRARRTRGSSRVSAHPLQSTAHGATQCLRPRRPTPFGSTDAPRHPRHLVQHLSPSSKMHAAPRNLQHRLCQLCHLCPLSSAHAVPQAVCTCPQLRVPCRLPRRPPPRQGALRTSRAQAARCSQARFIVKVHSRWVARSEAQGGDEGTFGGDFPQRFASGHARTCRVRVRPRSSRRLGGYGSGKHTLATRKVGASVASNARR